MEAFTCKTKIISGAGAITALADLHIQKLLLVCDPFFQKNGQAEAILSAARSPETCVFSEVVPDPSVELAAKGALVVQQFQPDGLVALGGGSAMDCAKAMAYFSGCHPTLIAIPTTSGSGSEVTNFSILTHQGVKHPLVDDNIRPDLAILDNDLVSTLPAQLVADGGFDLISHALEAYVATNAGPLSDLFAVGAFEAAMKQLYGSYCGDESLRGSIHRASTMAGIAFSSAGLGLCHGISHSLGGEFHVPHGRLNAILLPSVIDHNAAVCGHRYAQIARKTGIGSGSDAMALRALKNALLRLRRNLQLPETLAQVGLSPAVVAEKMDSLVRAALADPCTQTNPLLADPFIIKEIITEVTGRG